MTSKYEVINSSSRQQQKTVLKSSPEFQIAVNSAADCKIITDAQDVNPVRKLSLNSSKRSTTQYTYSSNNILFNSSLSRLTRVRWYQKKYSLTLCGYDTTSLINFLHFPWSTASYLHICCIWMTVFFYDLTPSFLCPALGLTPSTSKSMHFFHPIILILS